MSWRRTVVETTQNITTMMSIRSTVSKSAKLYTCPVRNLRNQTPPPRDIQPWRRLLDPLRRRLGPQHSESDKTLDRVPPTRCDAPGAAWSTTASTPSASARSHPGASRRAGRAWEQVRMTRSCNRLANDLLSLQRQAMKKQLYF